MDRLSKVLIAWITVMSVALVLSFCQSKEGFAEALYKCGGSVPLATNLAKYGCPPYNQTEGGMVLRSGEVKHFNEARVAVSEVCHAYEEWVSLNLKSQGGVFFSNPRELNRWQALAKIFTFIGVPHCE